ncbi:MAG TPA: type II secretion system F family protein [Candidatus Hydrogenedentes bacterium]|jgi:type IV pilus assembly protein PilC|nr:type II secretion system F family protein [Candidatus Hydrogenedentota bacterium]
MGLFSSQISAKKMVPLCRELATSYDAGIPIIRSLEIIGGQQQDRRIRAIFTEMAGAVKAGNTLDQAAREQHKYLPAFFTELIASGEVGGKLDVMLRDLADYYEDRLERQRRVVRMMALPVLELIAAWFLGTFALRLVGRIIGALSGAGGGNFDFEAFLKDYALFQIKALGVFAVLFVGVVILSRMGLFGWVSSLFTTHIYPLSAVTKRFALARFFRSLSLLIGAGVHVPVAIERSAAVTANPYIERDLLKTIPPVKQGSTLVEAFQRSRCLTPTAREMLLVGEESGKLDETLRKVADYHFEEANQAVDIAAKMFGVLLVLAVALTIGYIIVTFYMKFYGGMMDELGI